MDELARGLEMVECRLMEKTFFQDFFWDNLSLAARLARFSLFRPPKASHKIGPSTLDSTGRSFSLTLTKQCSLGVCAETRSKPL